MALEILFDQIELMENTWKELGYLIRVNQIMFIVLCIIAIKFTLWEIDF